MNLEWNSLRIQDQVSEMRGDEWLCARFTPRGSERIDSTLYTMVWRRTHHVDNIKSPLSHSTKYHCSVGATGEQAAEGFARRAKVLFFRVM
jgi:hypothetical protein